MLLVCNLLLPGSLYYYLWFDISNTFKLVIKNILKCLNVVFFFYRKRQIQEVLLRARTIHSRFWYLWELWHCQEKFTLLRTNKQSAALKFHWLKQLLHFWPLIVYLCIIILLDWQFLFLYSKMHIAHFWWQKASLFPNVLCKFPSRITGEYSKARRLRTCIFPPSTGSYIN